MATNSRVALVTGGAQGLGREIVRYLNLHGCRVVVFDIQKYEVLSPIYRNALSDYYEVDLADLPAISESVDKMLKRYDRLDILINNAALRIFGDYFEFDQPEIERYIDVNFGAPIMLVRKIYPFMKKKRYGRIINISSFSAFSGYSRGSIYCSTKCALNAFTEALGKEIDMGENVTINVICPDSFSTAEGKILRNYKSVVRRINKTINDIINSRRNGEVIVIAGRNRIIFNSLLEFRKRFRWMIGS